MEGTLKLKTFIFILQLSRVVHSELGKSHLYRKYYKCTINMNNLKFLFIFNLYIGKLLENVPNNVKVSQILNAYIH